MSPPNYSSLLSKLNNTYLEAFGKTPLKARLNDILKEVFELTRARDMDSMKGETSDVLGTLLQWINEAGYNLPELIEMNIAKINSRSLYRKLGRKISVALIGGAFDPIHNGHIELAQFLLNETKLYDEVWLVPCYRHLYGKEMVSTKSRLAMCRLYAQVDARIKVCDYEIVHELAGETYYFLNKFLEEDFAKNDYRFNYVIGMDNANSFAKWVNYEYLEKMIPFTVVSRQGEKRKSDVTWFLKAPHKFFDAGKKISNISSTEIKKRLKKNRKFDFEYHSDVANYIITNELYK